MPDPWSDIGSGNQYVTRLFHLVGWALILAAFFVIDGGGLAIGAASVGGVIAAITGVMLTRESWRELLRGRRGAHRTPLYLWIAGFLLGIAAIWIGGGADIPGLQVLLFPSGLLFATGGILLARDYGGSVDWMMTVFSKRQFGRPEAVEGRWGRFQMRGIGVFRGRHRGGLGSRWCLCLRGSHRVTRMGMGGSPAVRAQVLARPPAAE
jgi:hypothetical protein